MRLQGELFARKNIEEKNSIYNQNCQKSKHFPEFTNKRKMVPDCIYKTRKY